MGAAKRRKEAFLSDHPLCCFCGGIRSTASQDHVPGRATFLGRHSPRGFVFPACMQCQNISRLSEQVAAVIARVNFSHEGDETALAEFGSLLRSVQRNAPGLLEELMPTTRQTRNFMQKYGISTAHVSPSKIPVLNVSRNLMEHLNIFGRKLISAIHYRHTNKIIPVDGRIWIPWFSNVEIWDGRLPESAMQHFDRLESTHWNNQDLSDQFSYRWNAESGGRLGGYIVKFGGAMIIVALVICDPSVEIDFRSDENLFGPFDFSGT